MKVKMNTEVRIQDAEVTRKTVKNNGLVLVAVLWITMLLTVIVAAVSATARVDSKLSYSQMDSFRCEWACRAGVQTALAVLNEDPQDGDGLKDIWHDNDEDLNDIMLDDCRVRAVVIDECSKLNLNTANLKQLMALPNMTEEIAAAIMDWRDKDDKQRNNGVEKGYYLNLSIPYKIRNGSFRTIRELLAVRGVRGELLFGEDTNFNGELDYNEKDGYKAEPYDNGDDQLDLGWIEYLTCYSYENNVDSVGNKRVNINRVNENVLKNKLSISKEQAKWIVNNRSKQNNNRYPSIGALINNNSPKTPQKNKKSDQGQRMDIETFKKIADKISVTGRGQLPGKVNINTASETVLAALLAGDDNAEQVAEAIVGYRDELMTPMTSIGELLDVPSIDVKTFKKLANRVTTRSSIYTVRCFASPLRYSKGRSQAFAEAVIDRNQGGKYLYWYQGAIN